MSLQSLDDLSPADAALVGGKAWNCARLKQRGFPVPDGLAVPAGATDADVDAIGNDPWFDGHPADERYAVRSSGLDEDSAAQSFAGIHETALNVERRGIVGAVRWCRASADSDRAKAYRQARGMPIGAGAIGVLIQRMVQPTTSGVAFTIDPLTAAADELVINAAPGLGVAVVDGSVDPDEIRVRKADLQIVSYRIGATERSLHDSSVRELATMLTAIEREYGSAQDVEWCFDGAAFWILQSRPITTGPGLRSSAEGPGRTAVVDIEWTRANLAEVLPEMTSPQALAAIEEMLNIAERRLMGGLLAPYEQLGPIVKTFCGRLYFNISQMRHICHVTGKAPAHLLRSFGHAGLISPEDEQAPPLSLMTVLPRLPDFLRILGRHLRAEKLLRAHQAQVETFLSEVRSVDPASLADGGIWAVIAGWQQRSPETIEIVLLLGSVLFHELQLRTICARVGFPFERLLYSHLAAGERSVSAQQAFDLVALADMARTEPQAAAWLSRSDTTRGEIRTALAGTRFLAAFDRFLDRYGHRGIFESDWALPRYREDPSPILDAIRMHLRDGQDESRAAAVSRVEEDAAAIRSEFEQKMTGLQRLTLLPLARKLLTTIKHYYVWRELCRSDMIRVAAALRDWHLVLARRFVERGWLDRQDDYFFLLLQEIEAVIGDATRAAGLRAAVSARRAEAARNGALEMPLLMHESQLPGMLRASGVREAVSDTGDLRGTPVSRGVIESDVVVITDPSDFAHMKRGAILVTRATDPSWTPLFTLASGVIVEVGGVMSHASTIAREYGLPALANVKHATRRLRTGDRILLNATEGWARRVPAGERVA